MGMRAIDAARDYVVSAANRGVMSISPSAVARKLDVTEDQAVALLNCLETEGLVKLTGYIDCQACLDQIQLESRNLNDLLREAHSLACRPCPYCGTELPGQFDLKVKLSFFCLSAARTLAGPTSTEAVLAKQDTFAATIPDLQRQCKIDCHNLIIAQDGAVLTFSSNIASASGSGVVVGTGNLAEVGGKIVGACSTRFSKGTRSSDDLGRNPWVSGSFYLVAAVVIIAAIAVPGYVLPLWCFPLLIVGAIMIICLIGALQLRADKRLSEKNFLELIKMVFKSLPIIRLLSAARKDSASRGRD